MPKGEHREGYQRPGKDEPRRTRQPFAIEKLGAERRDAVLAILGAAKASRCTCGKRPAHWHSFGALPAVVKRETGVELSVKQVYGAYNVLIRQADREAQERDELADKNLKKYFGRTLEELPEQAVHALRAEVFGLMGARSPEEQQEAIGSFLFLLSKIIDAQAKQKRADIEERKLGLAEKKFADLRTKAEKALNEAEAKIGKGRQLTAADIDRIRERALGLPPRKREAPPGS